MELGEVQERILGEITQILFHPFIMNTLVGFVTLAFHSWYSRVFPVLRLGQVGSP